MTNRPVLVLNSSFEPISIASMRRAVKMIIKGVAIALESHDYVLYRKRMWDERNGEYIDVEIKMPSVVKLLEYRNIPLRIQVLSRKNIYVRDSYRCQYCGRHFQYNRLTLDHVIPTSRGGLGTYGNLVSCCRDCNWLKDNRLLTEGIVYPDDFPYKEMRGKTMRLLREPKPATIHTSRQIIRNMGKEDPKWRKYLYFEVDSKPNFC